MGSGGLDELFLSATVVFAAIPAVLFSTHALRGTGRYARQAWVDLEDFFRWKIVEPAATTREHRKWRLSAFGEIPRYRPHSGRLRYASESWARRHGT